MDKLGLVGGAAAVRGLAPLVRDRRAEVAERGLRAVLGDPDASASVGSAAGPARSVCGHLASICVGNQVH